MDTIETREQKAGPVFKYWVKQIRESGTDNLSFFGNGYTFEGGLSLQQNPLEFAALLCHVAEHTAFQSKKPTYLEIGSASGGAAVLLQEVGSFVKMLSIDDGTHGRYPELAKNFEKLPMEHLRADSHGPEAKAWLETMAATHAPYGFDVTFIDGDHSYEGVWADIQLTKPFWKKGGLVVFHDIIACEGVVKAWQQGTAAGYWGVAAEYIGPGTPGTNLRPLGIGIGIAP